MKIICGTTDFQLNTDTAVAMGKFDGIHVGHRKLLESILDKKTYGLKTCVFTFDPAPSVLFGLSDGRELSTKEEKRILFEKMGIDILVEFPMTVETAAIPAEAFVREYLCSKMRARHIAAGEDVSFGSRGAGNAALLLALKDELQYKVDIIEKVCVDGGEVSSTRIRTLIEAGEMEAAARLLGGPYTVSGTVTGGRQIGRTIGFPTVNLLPGKDKLMPRKGVYFSKVRISGADSEESGDSNSKGCVGTIYAGISNIGCKPTVSEENVIGVETFIYDFDRDIYGQNIEVELHGFLRPERKFDSLEDLQARLREDMAAGRRWHEMNEE